MAFSNRYSAKCSNVLEPIYSELESNENFVLKGKNERNILSK